MNELPGIPSLTIMTDLQHLLFESLHSFITRDIFIFPFLYCVPLFLSVQGYYYQTTPHPDNYPRNCLLLAQKLPCGKFPTRTMCFLKFPSIRITPQRTSPPKSGIVLLGNCPEGEIVLDGNFPGDFFRR